MRVISGKYKHRRFDVPHSFKARPTTDFAKENLFNVLNNLMDFDSCARALDLFAGTGSISVELLSRGCQQVVSVEKNYAHVTFIQKVKRELGDEAWTVMKADVFMFIERCRQPFDFIFADPPYALERLAELPDLVFSRQLLAEGGLFVLEHGADHSFAEHPHFLQEREYGSVHFSFFE
ncbi:MAG: RsmD family RNA methyltransferase [Bacteroidaceae bacterium]|nr:RsmD family RNA methyltransferase [Bacteroidaceae bacterium]